MASIGAATVAALLAAPSSAATTGRSSGQKAGVQYVRAVDVSSLHGVQGQDSDNPRFDATPPEGTKPGGGARGSLTLPNPPRTSITIDQPPSTGWSALSARDERLTENGNNFTWEPADSGATCVGDSKTMEGVNGAVAFFTKTGAILSPPGILQSNEFYGYPPAIDRVHGVYGPEIFDPQCYHDPQTDRWYFVNDILFTDPTTGDFTGKTGLVMAVSKTSNPTLGWRIYEINTTHSEHPGCPCFSDHPLVGADAYGFYISANEYSVFGSAFNGSIIYAFAKSEAESGTLNTTVVYPTSFPNGHYTYSTYPAKSGSATDWDTSNGGVEYFASSYDDPNPVSQIGVFALVGTSSLESGGTPTFQAALVDSEVYGDASDGSFALPKSQQRRGPAPLAMAVGEPINALDAGDTEMQQTYYAAGYLWGALGTAITGSGHERDGIAWFKVLASVDAGALRATIANQGYVAARGTDLLYPAVAVNADGNGVMAMTVNGGDYYPSAAYILVGGAGPTGDIHIASGGLGVRPEDGFTCYLATNGDRTRGCRWGDYNGANIAPSGNAFTEMNYISAEDRAFFSNWDTFIDQVDLTTAGTAG